MQDFSSRTIRLRIFLLTVATIIPVILLIVYINIVQLNSAKELEKEKLKTAAQIASTEHLQIIEGARQLLISLSVSPQVLSLNQSCSNYLGGLLNKYQRYNNFAVANTHGDVVCNAAALPTQENINVADRPFFKNVLNTGNFSVGEYSISKTTGYPILSFGYPIFDQEGSITHVIYSSLDLRWLKNLETSLSLGDTSILLILDRKGNILASNQDEFQIGTIFNSKNLISGLGTKNGFVEDEDSDVKFFYSYSQIGESITNPYAIVGLPESIAYQKPKQNFQQAITISAVIATLSILIGWFIGNSLITNVVLAMEKVEELRRDFVSLVSHQLRTPLTSIKYFSEILLSESPGKLMPKQNEFLSDIATSTNRLISLVGILVEVSRIESGKVQLKYESVSLSELTKESLSEISPSFQGKKIKFKITESKNFPPEILVDKKLIKQTISNLISNAYKYSYPKTTIDIKLKRNHNQVTFSVQNKGIRIQNKDKDLIFSKFYRAMDASKMHEEGTGLGLYLSQLIIRAHKGQISFSSTKAKTTFYFTLPIH